MQSLNTVKTKIAELKSAVILSHRSPDGDSIGSSLALRNFLMQKGLEITTITPDPAPDFLDWLDGFKEIINFEHHASDCKEKIASAEIIFCLDYNDPSRIGGLESAFHENTTAFKVNIDHHRDPKDFCDVQYSDIQASSTAELIYRFIDELGELNFLNKAMSEAMYTGILTDTGSFRFSSTTEKTHHVTAELIAKGVQPDLIYRHIYDSYSAERLKLLGYALYKAMKLYQNDQLAVIALDADELKNFNFKRGDTEGLVNYPLSIKSVQVSILLTEKDGLVKMSFRSKGEIPVNDFAKKYFGGGGHFNAAGGACKDTMAATLNILETNMSELIPLQ